MHAHALSIPAASPVLPPALAGEPAPVVLHHLRTPADIERVLPLRDGIDLSAHAAAGGAFRALEKKETSWASSAPSSATAS